MKLADSKKLIIADKEAVKYGVSALELMENASDHVAKAAAKLAGANHSCAVFCGSGNNGGDGFGAAVCLRKNGFIIRAYLIGNSDNMSDEANEMADRLEELGVPIESFDPNDKFTVGFAKNCGVIIDAIFGVGLSRPVEGAYRNAVELINASPAPVVSVDIASGVEADTGQISGCAVKATATVTFTMAKAGHFCAPGAAMRGELTIVDIGLPHELIDTVESTVSAINLNDLYIPPRASETYKWDYGRILIVAGSRGYTGAPVMASRAALRTGSGMVFLCVPDSIYDITAVKSDEVMVIPCPSNNSDGCFSEQAATMLKERLGRCDVCLLGCGLGRGSDTKKLTEDIIRNCRKPLIIDADGINAICGNINILKEALCPIIVTPHEKEFLRMGGDLSHGRLKGALKFAAEHNCAVVLKGSGTVTALPNGNAYINTTGNPGMAKGGSGDILAGMIASLIGQKFPPAQAAAYGVFLHGLAGDLCKKDFTEYAMTPLDMIEYISEAYKIILRK